MSARPLAIDLYCGLGGWSSGLLAEGLMPHGYLWYDSIWHTKRARSPNGSGKKLTSRLAVGRGQPRSRLSVTEDSSSKRAPRRSGHIAWHTRWSSDRFRRGCKFCIVATIRPASIQITSFSVLRPTIFATCRRRDGGNISPGIKAANAIQTRSSRTLRLRPCCAISRAAGGQ